MFRDLELGLIRTHILRHAAEAPVYGAGLLEELARLGYRLSFGTLYPTLHRLEADGLLAREDRVEGGRIRKYYRATDAGREFLTRARRLIAEINEELREDVELTTAAPEPERLLLIPLQELRAWQAGGRVPRPTLVDVRTAEEYIDGHLPGALLVPIEDLPSRMVELRPERPVVTYCTMRHRGNSRSERAAGMLRGHGYAARALDGGLPAWIGAGLPLERGSRRGGQRTTD